MATALLDLVGVLLIGAVGFLAAASVQGAALPARAEDILDRIGMGSLSAAEAGARLAVIGGVVLISKSLVYAWTLRRIFGFLASRQQQIASRMVRQVLAQSIRITATHSSQELL